jgi:hypothetical protein
MPVMFNAITDKSVFKATILLFALYSSLYTLYPFLPFSLPYFGLIELFL